MQHAPTAPVEQRRQKCVLEHPPAASLLPPLVLSTCRQGQIKRLLLFCSCARDEDTMFRGVVHMMNVKKRMHTSEKVLFQISVVFLRVVCYISPCANPN